LAQKFGLGKVDDVRDARRGGRPMLLQFAVGVMVAYGGIVGVIYLAQRSLMYVPDLARVSPTAAGLPQAEELTLMTADSEQLVAWHVPPRSENPVILYFPGNGGALRHRADRFTQLVQSGFGVVAISYRGFGGSTGSPSETGLLLDAETAYAFCTDYYAAKRIVVWGESLGTGVAVALAGKHLIGRLVLEAPFTSAADVARLSYPLIPVGLLMKDQFRSDARIGAITVPTLVLHGERDRVVPIALGERLYAAIRAPKRFVRFADGEHEGLDVRGAVAAVRDFLAATPDDLD
jgi:fermentation-respiration switch protein FrsA (DUF1100 family)